MINIICSEPIENCLQKRDVTEIKKVDNKDQPKLIKLLLLANCHEFPKGIDLLFIDLIIFIFRKIKYFNKIKVNLIFIYNNNILSLFIYYLYHSFFIKIR
jgi:hypothetical protein